MEFYRLNTQGDLNDRGLCIIDSEPEGLGIHEVFLKRGRVLGEIYPKDAKILMKKEYPGIRLSSILGNLKSYLIVEREVKMVIEDVCTNQIEYLPFTLINHKKRIHSADYFIINPIGGYDCMNLEASGVEYTRSGKPMEPDIFVFDKKKMDAAPHLFRVMEFPSEYIIDSYLVDIFKEKKFTNILLTKLNQVE